MSFNGPSWSFPFANMCGVPLNQEQVQEVYSPKTEYLVNMFIKGTQFGGGFGLIAGATCAILRRGSVLALLQQHGRRGAWIGGFLGPLWAEVNVLGAEDAPNYDVIRSKCVYYRMKPAVTADRCSFVGLALGKFASGCCSSFLSPGLPLVAYVGGFVAGSYYDGYVQDWDRF